MKKLVKLCLALFLILSAMPLNAHAQSDSSSIIVNDLVGEVRFIPKTQNLMKISLVNNSDGTVHKVLYYLTPNTSDVSLSQIKEDLSSQNIELDMMNMSIAEVDSEIKEYKTNLGLFTKQLVSVNIPLTNPDAVPVVGETGLELSSVTELPVLPSISDGEIIISINFKDESGTKLHAEHFLVYYDHNTDLLTMASDKFQDKFPEYIVDVNHAYQSKPISTEMQNFATDQGEIKAFSMEMTVPVKQKLMDQAESLSEQSTSESVTQSSVSKSKTEESISQLSVNKTKSTESSTSTVQSTKKNLPSTGENMPLSIVMIAGLAIILSALLMVTTLAKKVKK
ncbi:hypothetical protein NHG23_02140 [Aerococcaceae bacterium NML190073]|nr:hypothetical protein [Aerococcaceae bacterium NML190073]